MSALTAWLATLALHAAILLALAFALDAALPARRAGWRELLWRAALFGAFATASVQALLPQQSRIERWHWSAPAIAASERLPAPAAATSNPTARAPAQIAERTRITPAPAREPAAMPDGSPRIPWIRFAFAAWLTGALIALARLGRRLIALRNDLRHAVSLDDEALGADLAALATAAGRAPPRLLRLDDLGSPIAATGGRIVLPGWALDELSRTQLRAMLAHELGHVVRADAAWKVAGALGRAVLWFLPPAARAQRRLDELAELACDAFAAQHTGDARGLAECLATCAEHQRPDILPVFAPAMAARPSALIQRIDRLLEGVSMDTSAVRALPRVVAVLALALAAIALPAVGVDVARAQDAPAAPPVPPSPPSPPAAPAPPSAAGHSSISIHSDDDGNGTMTISYSDDAHKFRATVAGKIAFNDDETDVESLGAGGSATIQETRDGITRGLELAERNGKLERRYFVDRSEQPLDAPARTWIASAVKQLVRSGIGAEARTKRLYAKGGARLVLDEIAQIPTDYVRGIYLRTLVALGKLTPEQLDRAVKLAGAMSSDYERRQALSAVFDHQALAADEQVTFLRQALRFDSDYERAELLVGALPGLANTDAVRQAWLDAGLQVKSDYERRRTLTAMLARGGLDAAQTASVIAASNSMQSDYEHRELLVAAATQLHDPDAIAAAYARSAQKIGSDYEHREALLALLRSGRIGAGGASAVLDSAAQIGSSYERREVLVALARVMPDSPELQARYRAVAADLADYDRKQAESALAR